MAGVSWRLSIADVVAIIAALAAVASAAYSRQSAQVAERAQTSSEQIGRATQRSETFTQFQDQYNATSTRFPARYLDPKFRPSRGSDDYARLEAYWFFCFSEWYATKKVNGDALEDLWTNYYKPLIADGINIPSLRYTLEDRIRLHGAGRGEWRNYLRELVALAEEGGHPLNDDVQGIIMKEETSY